jgi:hypothetical protein
MDTDNLALRVARIAKPRLDLDDASAAIDAIAARGHRFVAPGTLGTLQSEDEYRNLARDLRSKTQISFAAAFGVLDAIGKIGFQISQPLRIELE